MKMKKHLFTFGALLGFSLGACLAKMSAGSTQDESVGLEQQTVDLEAEAENKFYQLSTKIQDLLGKLDYSTMQSVSKSLRSKIETKLKELGSLLA